MCLKKCILLIICLFGTISISNAQNIKAAYERQKTEKEYERQRVENELKEVARIQKARLSLSDLLQLVQNNDLNHIDMFLTEKGWKIYSTDADESDYNDEEMPLNHEKVTWAFDRDSYQNRAKAWFYAYTFPNYNNATLYSISDELELNQFRIQLSRKGFTKTQEKVSSERGFESIYRNETYQVNFVKNRNRNFKDGSEIYYMIYIYNFKQIEEQKAEELRVRKIEEEYNSAIQGAEQSLSEKDYLAAKQFYSQAIRVKPETKKLHSDILNDIDINILCQNADDFYNSKQYSKSIEEYNKALLIKPNRFSDYISEKIRNIEEYVIYFKSTIHDYKDVEKADYDIYYDKLEIGLRDLLLNLPTIHRTYITIICELDSLGLTSSRVKSSIEDKALKNGIESLAKNIRLKPLSIENSFVRAKAEFVYRVESKNSIVVVKKKSKTINSENIEYPTYQTYITKELIKSPIGIYTFNLNPITINNQEYNNHKIVKMRRTGGPSNGLLSILIPGWGKSNVTGGEKNGVSTAVSVYLLIGAGVGIKKMSNNDYNKYNNYSTADEELYLADPEKNMNRNEYLNSAKTYNVISYACLSLGAVIWISETIWITNKGIQNKKAQKAWKKGHLSLYHNSEFNANGLTYALRF
ncbi:MAG: hypothetical protein WC135_02385 [Bacteroidales bacterium]